MKELVTKYLGTGITVVLAVLLTTNVIQPMINKSKISSPSMQ
jgi:hypothetical protein